ncbi:MAG: hypothetical protein RR328_01470, partial [Bacteroidales bacterium]
LKQGQSYLFENPKLANKVYIISANDTLSTSFTYNKSKKTLSWTMPALQKQTQYTIQICAKPKAMVGSQNTPIQTQYTKVLNMEGSTVEQRNNSLSEASIQSQKYFFRIPLLRVGIKPWPKKSMRFLFRKYIELLIWSKM